MRLLPLILAATLASCTTDIAPSPTATRADTLMRELAGRDRFQGAVVIQRGARVEYAAGFGFADIERRVPFTPDTPMDGGSIAKPFTAAALLMLAHERRIDLDAPVRTLLPAYPHDTTRVRHLLAHSAGLPDYGWFDPPRSPPDTVRSNASHLALLAHAALPPAFAPGTAYRYDNLAYDTAALLIEKASGQSWQEVIAQRFLGPLAMTSTFVRPARFADWRGAPRTRGYRRTAEGWQDHDAHDFEGFHGAANLYVSARDLARFMHGYRQVVGADVLRSATTPARLDDSRATGMTLGCWYAADEGRRRYYTGSHNGFYTFGYADDERGLAVAWVSNDSMPGWLRHRLARALIAVVEGREAEPIGEPPAAAAVVADPAGRYRVPGIGSVVIRADGPRLFVTAQGVEYEAFAVGRSLRYVPGLDAFVRFAATPEGGVSLSWDSVFVAPTPSMRQ